MTDRLKEISVGLFGVISPTAGLAVSFASQLEPWLRDVSLLVGIAGGVLIIIRQIKKL